MNFRTTEPDRPATFGERLGGGDADPDCAVRAEPAAHAERAEHAEHAEYTDAEHADAEHADRAEGVGGAGEDNERAAWFQLTSAASVGIEMAVAVGFCAWLGLTIQNRVPAWRPWPLVIGLVIGVGAAINAIVRTARVFQAQLAREEAARALHPEAGVNSNTDAGETERRR